MDLSFLQSPHAQSFLRSSKAQYQVLLSSFFFSLCFWFLFIFPFTKLSTKKHPTDKFFSLLLLCMFVSLLFVSICKVLIRIELDENGANGLCGSCTLTSILSATSNKKLIKNLHLRCYFLNKF